MIIQIVLLIGLSVAVLYALMQRRKSRLVSTLIFGVSMAGMFFVLFPEKSTEVAVLVGVGRGADLVLYCWILISLVVSMNLQFKLLSLQETVTELAREIAIRTPLGQCAEGEVLSDGKSKQVIRCSGG